MSDTSDKIAMFITGTIIIAALAVLFGLLFAFPVMWTWNYVMPDVFGLPVITFWQAFWMKFLFFFLIPTSTGPATIWQKK